MAIPMFTKEMLVKHKYAVIGAVLALVLISWLCWYFSDQQVVKRQLVGLSWEVSKKSSQESTMETALKMRKVQSALADNCTLIIPERKNSELVEKDLAVRYLMYYRDRYQVLAVTFEEMDIKFPAKGEAAVRATVLLKKQMPQAPPAEVTAPVTLMLKKQNGDWLLTQAEIAAALLDD
jgi:hypothetical protein